MNRRPNVTQAQKLAVLKRDAIFMCPHCKRELPASEAEFDHAHGLADLGPHDIENIRCLCGDCHREKSKFETKRRAHMDRIIEKRERPRPPSRLRSRGFDKTKTRKFNGIVEQRK